KKESCLTLGSLFLIRIPRRKQIMSMKCVSPSGRAPVLRAACRTDASALSAEYALVQETHILSLYSRFKQLQTIGTQTVKTRFRTSLLAMAALAALLMAIPASLRAQIYTIRDLDTLGSTDSYANGINSKGQVVGSVLTANGFRPFLYSNGVMTALG